MQERHERSGLVPLAFGSLLAGWACGSVVFAAWMFLLQGSFDDVGVVLAWAAMFAFAGWLLTFLPLVLLVTPDASLWAPSRLPWIGGMVGFAAFFALVGWGFAADAWRVRGFPGLWVSFAPYAAYAAVTGAVAGLVYSRALARRLDG